MNHSCLQCSPIVPSCVLFIEVLEENTELAVVPLLAH